MAKVNAQIVRTVKKFLKTLNEQGIKVETAYIFGSYAAGKENQWSDIDVAVISSDISDDRLNERVRLARVSYGIDRRLEPVPFRPEAFVDEDPLAWEIKRKGLRIAV